MAKMQLAHLANIQRVLEALPADTSVALAALAVEDAYVALVGAAQCGLSLSQVIKSVGEVFSEVESRSLLAEFQCGGNAPGEQRH